MKKRYARTRMRYVSVVRVGHVIGAAYIKKMIRIHGRSLCPVVGMKHY
jgi:hypothetical protein